MLPTLNGWKHDPKSDSINKSFKFGSFALALGFITTLGVEAQVANHHPELFNVYDRVDIAWRTHDCQGLSSKDIEMAKKCDELYRP